MEERLAAARSEALPRERRLAKRGEFLRVYEAGRKLFARYIVLFYSSNGLSISRVGVTVTRKVGKATVRNRLKRWTREVYRREREPLRLDERRLDFVVNVKTNAAGASYRQYADDLAQALRRATGEPA